MPVQSLINPALNRDSSNPSMGAFLFSRLARLHFTTGLSRSAQNESFTFNPDRGWGV
jgi:hypothetical protein